MWPDLGTNRSNFGLFLGWLCFRKYKIVQKVQIFDEGSILGKCGGLVCASFGYVQFVIFKTNFHGSCVIQSLGVKAREANFRHNLGKSYQQLL